MNVGNYIIIGAIFLRLIRVGIQSGRRRSLLIDRMCNLPARIKIDEIYVDPH